MRLNYALRQNLSFVLVLFRLEVNFFDVFGRKILAKLTNYFNLKSVKFFENFEKIENVLDSIWVAGLDRACFRGPASVLHKEE